MQNQNGNLLRLRIITPDMDPVCADCDSIRLWLSDDANGCGGGAYGVLRGHEACVLALSPGPLSCSLNGAAVLNGTCGDGFARIENNVVTVTVESAVIERQE